MTSFLPLLPATLLLFSTYAPIAAAQTVGGEFEMLYQWDGGAPVEFFGYSVDDAGDVNNDGFADMIIGAHRAGPGGLADAGSAFVFSGADGSVLHQWDGAATMEVLGCAVSGVGDVNHDGFDDVIVGAYHTSPGGITSAGAAYVYSGQDGSTLFQWFGTNADDYFGGDVSGAGDVNADGYPDFLVGAGWSSPGGLAYAGAAFVYSGADGSLLYEWTGGASGDFFGADLCGAGDVNADGFDDLLIGSFGGGPVGLDFAGAAYVYSGADGSMLYQWQGSGSTDYLGASVSRAGDVNADGFDDLIVGAPFTNPGGLAFAGSAFVYSGADGSQLYQWNGLEADEFGWSVSDAGDVNKDGYADVIIGAQETTVAGIGHAGAAYVYSGADGSVLQEWYGHAMNDKFGASVSGAGDVNNNGYPDLMVSAIAADPGGNSIAGSTYIYSFNPFIDASATELSIAIGGTVDFQLNFPDTASNYEYKVLASSSGTGPTLYGVDIPLTNDLLVQHTFAGNYPGISGSNPQGTLDVNGQATGTLSISAGNWSSLIGNTYHLAAIAYPTGQLPEYSSIAVPLTIVP